MLNSYIYTHIYIYVHIYMCIYTCYTWIYICIYINLYIHAHVCAHVLAYMHMYICIYMRLAEHPTTTEVAVGEEPTQLRRTHGRAETGSTQDTRSKFRHARETTGTNAYRQVTDMLCTTYWAYKIGATAPKS